MRKLIVTSATAAWAGLVLVSAAVAAGDGEKVGENLGHLLSGWARSLYLGIAGLVALLFLLNRRFADLAIFLIGGFVMAPNDIASTVRDIWHTVAG
jgi:hypothetical protein